MSATAVRAGPEKERALFGSALSRKRSTDLSTTDAYNGTAPAASKEKPEPHSDEAEQGLLGSALIDPDVLALCEGTLGSRDFYVPAHQTIYTVLVELRNAGQAIDLITFTQTLRDRNVLDAVGGASFITSLFTFVPTAANLPYYLDIVREKSARRTAIREAESVIIHARDESSEFEVEDSAATESAELETTLASRRFDVNDPPPIAVPRFKLEDAIISTPGNLTAIQAQAKGGKTAFLAGMMGATMAPTGDCLGVTADNPHGLAVVHLDTEQSPADHHAVVAGALQRAGRTSPPDWLRSYRLADVPLAIRQQIIPFEMERAAKECGGVYCLLLDGGADFIIDPNDSAEAFTFVDDLHQLAIRFETSIVAVIHENPSSELGKTRGHLGSQLERKAETNLRLFKDGDGITTVFAERARHAHIPKEHGSRFVWSDEKRMHVSTDAPAKGRPKAFEPDEILELMGGECLTFAEAFARCSEEGGWKQTTFKHAWKQLKTSGQLVESVMEKGKWGSKRS